MCYLLLRRKVPLPYCPTSHLAVKVHKSEAAFSASFGQVALNISSCPGGVHDSCLQDLISYVHQIDDLFFYDLKNILIFRRGLI